MSYHKKPRYQQQRSSQWKSSTNGFTFQNPSRWTPAQTKNFNNLTYEDQKRMLGPVQNNEQAQTDYAGGITQDSLDAWAKKGYKHDGGGVFSIDPNKKKETSWWDTIGNTLGADGPLGGVKGWLDLGTEAMKAYTGYQQVGLAREQNQLGRDAFSFQKAAWNKDYDARKIAYNTNARDVNAWKAAQTPGGYTMSELVV